MKKLLLSLLALLLVALCGSAAMASTIGVAVDQGIAISAYKDNCAIDTYAVAGKFGINDNWLVKVAYYPETDADHLYTGYVLGVRYEFAENQAITLDYGIDSDISSSITLGYRFKYFFSDPFAIVGVVDYSSIDLDAGTDYNSYSITANLEYSFTDFFTGTFGINYFNNDSTGVEDSLTTYTLGLEFYLGEMTTVWIDYSRYNNDTDGVYGIGIEFAF